MPRKLSEAAKAEIAEAVRILREDGVHIHKSYAAFQKGLTEQSVNDPPEEDVSSQPPADPGEGDPPPPKPDGGKKPERKSIWWGDRA